MLMGKKSSFLFFIFLYLLIITLSVSAIEPTDISNHWAQDYILNLVNKEIMEIYPDGLFKPDQPTTRGEFAVALAKQLKLVPDLNHHFEDLKDYPGYELINALNKKEIITGYPDKSFRPEKEITRAEMVTIMIKSIGINKDEVTIRLTDTEAYKDVPENHWAINHIKIASILELVNGDEKGYFHPDKTASRAEAAKLLTKLAELTSNTGYITDVYPSSRKVSFNSQNGERIVYNFNDTTLIGRNNRFVQLDEILKTDKVFIIADKSNNLKYLKAYGLVTQEDITAEISKMTDGFFESEEIKELSSGNLELLKPKLQGAIREQLVSQGLSTEEIEALMRTDWAELEELGRMRLSEAIAIQTGLSLDITRSILSGDWDKVKTYGQIELIQRLVQEVLNSDLLS
ncbi:MAG: S-layer homology domain-containing protein [Halanaerobiaceae bacterium]|nr:S-layer homology domain-containing protein [Halanaerobiaceae bacterium]